MWAVNESSTTLNLRKNTMYTVNISICPDMPYTSQFTVGNYNMTYSLKILNIMPIPIILGRCPSVINSVTMTIVNYNISRNGATTALIMCS